MNELAVIVTGAGSGIGKAIATSLARRGVRVLVNDYGGGTDGTGGGSESAKIVAEEIIAAGGTAIANCDAVGSTDAAARIRDAALDAFGRIDALVNNAGIVVSAAIDDISDEQFSRVVETNYRGPQRLIQAVWPHMKLQKFGRIINVSSNASLGFGLLSAYSSSKAAMLGLTADLAIEGQGYGILVNSILPAAATRLSGAVEDHADDISTAFTSWLKENFQPEKVVPIVEYLLRRDCIVSGRHFTTGGGRVAILSSAINDGYFNTALCDNDIANNIHAILDTTTLRSVGRAEEEILAYSAYIPM